MDFNFFAAIIFIFCGVMTVAATIQHFYIRYLVKKLHKLQQIQKMQEITNTLAEQLFATLQRAEREAAERLPHNTDPINLNTPS